MQESSLNDEVGIPRLEPLKVVRSQGTMFVGKTPAPLFHPLICNRSNSVDSSDFDEHEMLWSSKNDTFQAFCGCA